MRNNLYSKRRNAGSAENFPSPATALFSAVGGALCPDSNVIPLSFVSYRGIKPLLQPGVEPTRPEAGFHLSE